VTTGVGCGFGDGVSNAQAASMLTNVNPTALAATFRNMVNERNLQ
jgi:hypothetical protein